MAFCKTGRRPAELVRYKEQTFIKGSVKEGKVDLLSTESLDKVAEADEDEVKDEPQ